MTSVKEKKTDIQLKMGDRVSSKNISSNASIDDLKEVINGLLGNECEFNPYQGIPLYIQKTLTREMFEGPSCNGIKVNI